MKPPVIFTEKFGEQLRIVIKPRIEGIIYFSTCLIACLYIFVAYCCIRDIQHGKYVWFNLISMLIFIYVGLRYAGSLFYREILIVTTEQLYIGYRSLLQKRKSTHRICDIAYMSATEDNGKEHSQAYEQLYGISAMKLERDLLNSEGRIRFFDRGRAVRFGIGLSPDQTVQLINLLQGYSDNDLSAADIDEQLGIV
ncbi:hypothetical protein [Edaphocola aurantiacus]|uniref:hypothetical protein n=1 Tax=Edaphocola aurantiacus TaxID=2601682 RepID=UPI001C93B685|nr:hypothetical protein [Edaphocola aurantiacus]